MNNNGFESTNKQTTTENNAGAVFVTSNTVSTEGMGFSSPATFDFDGDSFVVDDNEERINAYEQQKGSEGADSTGEAKVSLNESSSNTLIPLTDEVDNKIFDLGFGFENFVGGSILGSINNSIGSYLGGSLSVAVKQADTSNRMGQLSSLTADIQQNSMQFYTNLGSAALSLGSALGPEGMAVGALAAGAIDAYGYSVSSEQEAQVQSTSGVLVNQ
jgi:hypothetical protein